MQLFVFMICFTIGLCNAISEEEVENLKKICSKELFDKDIQNLPRMVRLAFHDAVGENGADGCLDLNNADNAGLAEIYAEVVALYKGTLTVQYRSLLSQADFLALCGVAAVERAYEPTYKGDAKFLFKTGRKTTESCSGGNNGVFPSPLGGYKDTMDFLKTQFGLSSDREAIVLLGAHSLGDALVKNSGFKGPWTSNEHGLDNEYYSIFLKAENEKWRQVDVGKGKIQWQKYPVENTTSSKRPLMMLNADMCLLKDIKVDENGESMCGDDVSNCTNSPGRPIVEELSGKNDVFIAEFIKVFTKMIEKVPKDVSLTEAKTSGTSTSLPAFAMVLVVFPVVNYFV